MPRKWTNSYGGNGGGNVKHRFVETTPVRMKGAWGVPPDWQVDQTLASNARIATKEQRKQPRR